MWILIRCLGRPKSLSANGHQTKHKHLYRVCPAALLLLVHDAVRLHQLRKGLPWGKLNCWQARIGGQVRHLVALTFAWHGGHVDEMEMTDTDSDYQANTYLDLLEWLRACWCVAKYAIMWPRPSARKVAVIMEKGLQQVYKRTCVT